MPPFGVQKMFAKPWQGTKVGKLFYTIQYYPRASEYQNKEHLTCESHTVSEYDKKSLNIKLIAITGSVGKTSTKDFLSSIINKKFRCYANEGNYNNKFGVPLSLYQIPKKTY